jgi:hypothetical protein
MPTNKKTYKLKGFKITCLYSMIISFLIIFQTIDTFAGQNKNDIALFVDNLFHITEVMVTDVASPPAAARFYAYTTLAAHIAWSEINNVPIQQQLIPKSITGALNLNEPPQDLNPKFISVYSMLEVGKIIMPSGKLLANKQDELVRKAIKNKWISKISLSKHL